LLGCNFWSAFKTERLGLTQKSNLIAYNDLLLVLGQYDKGLSLATLNLESDLFLFYFEVISIDINFLNFKRTGKECRCSLFMNEEKSDVKIKVEGFFLPAHKIILKEKSKYFANLFKSKQTLKKFLFILFRRHV